MSIKQKKYLVFSLSLTLFISISHKAEAQLMMSVSGSYDLPMQDLGDQFQIQYSGNVNLHYKLNDKPFEAFLGISLTPFRATEEVEAFYKYIQQDTLGFEFEIHKYSAPILLGLKYYPFDKEKIQAYVSAGFGLQYLVDKTKMVGDYTSTTIKENEWKMMVKAEIGVVYRFKPDLGVQLSAGYFTDFQEEPVNYLKLGLGIIYNI